MFTIDLQKNDQPTFQPTQKTIKSQTSKETHFTLWPEFTDLDQKIGAESLRALEIRQKNRNPNECWWWWWWMASIDVPDDLWWWRIGSEMFWVFCFLNIYFEQLK